MVYEYGEFYLSQKTRKKLYNRVIILYAMLMVVPTFLDGLTQLLLPRDKWKFAAFFQRDNCRNWFGSFGKSI